MEPSEETRTPKPDPTTLTTAQLQGAIKDLRELIASERDGDRRLNDERFRAVEARFADQNKAVDAAFQSATKQTDGLAALISSNAVATGATIGDVKDRVTKLESEERGAKGNQTDNRGTWGMVVGIGGLIIAIIMAFARFGGIVK